MFVTLMPRNFSLEAKEMGVEGGGSYVALFYYEYSKDQALELNITTAQLQVSGGRLPGEGRGDFPAGDLAQAYGYSGIKSKQHKKNIYLKRLFLVVVFASTSFLP